MHVKVRLQIKCSLIFHGAESTAFKKCTGAAGKQKGGSVSQRERVRDRGMSELGWWGWCAGIEVGGGGAIDLSHSCRRCACNANLPPSISLAARPEGRAQREGCPPHSGPGQAKTLNSYFSFNHFFFFKSAENFFLK